MYSDCKVCRLRDFSVTWCCSSAICWDAAVDVGAVCIDVGAWLALVGELPGGAAGPFQKPFCEAVAMDEGDGSGLSERP